MKVTCMACGKQRAVSRREYKERSVRACKCGNGSYTGIDWNRREA